MIYIFRTIRLLWAGATAAKRRVANEAVGSSATRLARKIESDKITADHLTATYDTLIRRKEYYDTAVTDKVTPETIIGAVRSRLGNKYTISNVFRLPGNYLLLLGNAQVKEYDPSSYSGQLRKLFDTPLFIKTNTDQKELEFYSVFPDDKHHQILLQDLCDAVFPVLVTR